jgi:hypothetical protein
VREDMETTQHGKLDLIDFITLGQVQCISTRDIDTFLGIQEVKNSIDFITLGARLKSTSLLAIFGRSCLDLRSCPHDSQCLFKINYSRSNLRLKKGTRVHGEQQKSKVRIEIVSRIWYVRASTNIYTGYLTSIFR